MKKLVTAFAACMIAGLVSAQSVTSLNIVGYQTVPLTKDGFTATGPTLAPVNMTGGNMTLGDIAANEFFAPFEDSIQIFDASGSVVIMATYVSQANLDLWEMGPEYLPGWYDYADGELQGGTLNSTVIAAGQGMTAFTGYSDVTIIIPNPLP